ncbi:hypothetical protein TOPH_05243 [Tolypocladium ophioglossoides CBS 100239]|uniref:Uncharacterized protein n=1 Tax=Tolypocladium ophioglossoides (strain CBS 100239) TaxID=1163406 RepID=A0A0L0N7U9_TOLOC|nr:hypothetical protein TOPH_05243 [Tolypocladium ophioglossoides CBS 100239]
MVVAVEQGTRCLRPAFILTRAGAEELPWLTTAWQGAVHSGARDAAAQWADSNFLVPLYLHPNLSPNNLRDAPPHRRFLVGPRGIHPVALSPHPSDPFEVAPLLSPPLLPSLPPHLRIVFSLRNQQTRPRNPANPLAVFVGPWSPASCTRTNFCCFATRQAQPAAPGASKRKTAKVCFRAENLPLFLPLTSSSPVFKSLQPQSRPHHVLCLHCQPPQPPSSHLSHLPSTTWEITKRKALEHVDAHVYRSSAAAPEREKRIPLEFHTSSRTSARPLFTTLTRAVATLVKSLHAHCRENSIPPTSSLHQHVFLRKSTECR